MRLYQCRGQLATLVSSRKGCWITIQAVTQFDCKKNSVIKESVSQGGITSSEKTVFNIFIPVKRSAKNWPIYKIVSNPRSFSLPADYPIYVSSKFLKREDVLDIESQQERTFVIRKVHEKKKNSPYKYEIQDIQLGSIKDDA
jgi:hypothetical protein